MKVLKGLHLILPISLLLASLASMGGAMPVYAASLPPTLKFIPVVGGLNSPVFVTNAGDGSNRLFIVQQTGQIRIFKNGSLLSTPFLNILGLVSNFTGINGEQGLLSLAFDPNYSTNGFFYITYTTNNSDPTFLYTTTLARYQVSSTNPDQADPSSGAVLLSIPKKYTNHNGGMLAFGPNGYLYMSMGDGGSGGDPDNNAQNLHTLLGKILRLDVESSPPAGQTYVIPPTNPFYGSTDSKVKKEIWAYGLRNPWRFSFDRSSGDLYIGDVGQNTEEEVDFQAASNSGGQNYGWHILEGNLCYDPSTGCVAPSGYVPPVATYDHGTNESYGCAVIGGYVYRGSTYPALQGVYFYGDLCTGKIFGLVRNSNNTWSHSLITSTGFTISSFGQDEQGELYVVDYGNGVVYQITPGPVRISGNLKLGGVSLGYTDGTAKTATSQANGNYSILVPSNWSGTITPSSSCYTFNPLSFSYANVAANLTGQNFTYTAVTGCGAGSGIYDDTDAGWTYTGSWIARSSLTGPLDGTDHYTNQVGATASFTFNASVFVFYYVVAPSRGEIQVWVDGRLITSLDANGSLKWQAAYISPYFTPGTHTVSFRNVSSSSSYYVDVDAIRVVEIHDDADSAWTYTGSWTARSSLTGPYLGTDHSSSDLSATASLTFSGSGFVFKYVKASNRGSLQIWVDGSPLTTLNANSSQTLWQVVYLSPPLSTGTHTVQITNAGPAGKYIDVDSLRVLP